MAAKMAGALLSPVIEVKRGVTSSLAKRLPEAYNADSLLLAMLKIAAIKAHIEQRRKRRGERLN